MPTYAIPVQKSYISREHDSTKDLHGTLRLEANSSREALVAVLREMAARKISTIDPRIEWDEDFEEGNGWDYVDYSFQVDDESLPEDGPTELHEHDSECRYLGCGIWDCGHDDQH